MKFWRVSSFLLSLCFICLTVSVPALAAGSDDLSDLPIQDFVIPGTPAESFAPMQRPDLVEPSAAPELAPFIVQGDNGIMMAAEDSGTSDTWWLTSDFFKSVFYGYGTYTNQQTAVTSLASYAHSFTPGGFLSLTSKTFTSSSSNCHLELYKDVIACEVYTTIDLPSADSDSVTFRGHPDFSLVCSMSDTTLTAGAAEVFPTTVALLINGDVYGDPVVYGQDFDVTINFQEDETVSKISSWGFYFGFSQVTKNVSDSVLHDNIRYFGINTSLDNFSMTGASPTVGLLKGILAMLQRIVDAVLSLPSNIANAIGSVLKSLFVPSDADFQELYSSLQNTLETKLGFIYTAGTTVYDLISGIYDALHSPAAGFHFPGISVKMNGQVHVIAAEQDFTISDNAVVSTVQLLLQPVLVAIFALYLINLCHNMYECIISGYSYMDFLHRGKGGED